MSASVHPFESNSTILRREVLNASYGQFPLQYCGDGTDENLPSRFFDYRLSA